MRRSHSDIVLLPLRQSCGIAEAVALLKNCHIPQQLTLSLEGGVGNPVAGEGDEGDGVGGVGGGAQPPPIVQGAAGGCGLEAAEVEADLAAVGPQGGHCYPTYATSKCSVRYL